MKPQISRFMIPVLLTALLGAGGAGAQNVDYEFHWAPSPIIDGDGIVRPAAVNYEVFLRRGAGADELIATVADTTYTLSAEPGVVQRLIVRGVDDQGRVSPLSEPSDPIYFEVGTENRSVPGVPLAAELGDNYPNPFNPETQVVYGVPADATGDENMRLEIYNVQGQLVRRLEVDRSPGWHEVTWDGTSDQGVVAATGLYLTRFTVGTMATTAKMTMIK